jgi:hypothetical protein
MTVDSNPAALDRAKKDLIHTNLRTSINKDLPSHDDVRQKTFERDTFASRRYLPPWPRLAEQNVLLFWT